ncbi:MAG TPA: DMT family transporter [Thermomicrobiales bacterium]|nr:DMT family transporter [Thermomicrobiales bacterium]
MGESDAGEVGALQVAWLLSLGLIWGSSYLFIKLLVDAASPSVMIAVRLTLGLLTLGAVMLARGERLPRWGRPWRLLLVMSIAGNVVPFTLITWAEQHVTSALAAVLSATTPLFTLLVSALVFRHDRLSGARLAGLAVGFAGVVLLTGRSVLDVGSSDAAGTLALLASSVCYGFSFAFARQYIRGNPVSNVTAQLAMSLAIMAPFALLGGWVEPDELNATNVTGWVILGALGTGVAYLFYYALIRAIGATPASLVTYIIPPVGLLLGWLALEEDLGINGVAGMLLIVAGVAVAYGWHRRLLPRAT